jgi:ketosteroid isomerase-like protein
MRGIIHLTLLFFVKMAFSQTTNADISNTIIGLEKEALDKWNTGDPEGYLNISADDVTYFDPFTEQRLDGLMELTRYYQPIKGQVQARYEMFNPNVVATNSMAVLTFNLHSYEGDKVIRWNCTEVYRLEPNGQWKIVQTHWSFIKPGSD